MSSQHLKEVKSQSMEEKTSKALNGTMEISKGDTNDGLNIATKVRKNVLANNDEPGLYHLDKKVKVRHAPILSLDTHSNNTNSADLDMMNSSIYSTHSKAAEISQYSQSSMSPEKHSAKILQSSQSSMSPEKHSAKISQSSQSSMSPEKHSAKILQSSQSSMSPEKYSAGRQLTTRPTEYFNNTLQDISDSGTSEDESPNPPVSETFHARYRKSGSDLMTLHMFTGKMNGKKPKYEPVYIRNDCGKLLKLVPIPSGHWQYLELKKLTEEEEAEGLELFKAEVVLQSSEPKKARGRRTLADFGLPETKSRGGWGWL